MKDKPKDLAQWLEEDGLPAIKSILAELKALNKPQVNEAPAEEQDPMPKEEDFYTGGADASGEVYDMLDKQSYNAALDDWKKRQTNLLDGK